jgi:hypothetical protein
MIPVGAIVTSAAASQGTFLLDNSETVFSLGSVGVGTSAMLTLTVTPTTVGVLTNHVELASSVADLDPSNNTLEQHTQATPGLEAVLNAHFDSGQLAISWASALTGYHVEYAQDLESATGWQVLSAAPVLSGDVLKVTAPVTGLRRFYRLAR